jgi:cell fate regulator YaaT (PSP1 superfamily)
MKNEIENLRGCANQLSDNGKCNLGSCNKLNVFNEYKDLPINSNTTDIVEVRFKNTRKAFFKNVNKLKLVEGDMVAVEASPGHDIGIISLSGEMVIDQIRRKKIDISVELKKVYRKVKPLDIEKWEEAIAREEAVMLQTRRIAKKLKLDMKIGDVEFQGDGTKAIFYYIADERVDFRELIKILADEFKIRIEMKQIGARQEAGRIGGIGSCGRELCCSSWMSDFVSVSTDSAREQEISLNPQKLAGQCGKLKCCLNYELKNYTDAKSKFPRKDKLETAEGSAYHIKTDVFKGMMWYSFDERMPLKVTGVSIERVKEVIELNKKGIKPEKLVENSDNIPKKGKEYIDLLGQESITRFDEKKRKNKHKKRNPDNSQTSVNKDNNQNNNIEKKEVSKPKREIPEQGKPENFKPKNHQRNRNRKKNFKPKDGDKNRDENNKTE